MNNIIEFFKNNPQIGAAIITAICGILGIFINIFINIIFRNKDYRAKNKIKQTENITEYYFPLNEKIMATQQKINQLKSNKITSFSEIDKQDCSKNDKTIKEFIDSTKELSMQFSQHSSRYQNDYGLYKIHRAVKYQVDTICQHFENNTDITDFKLLDFYNNLNTLSIKIRRNEAKLLAPNIFVRIYEYHKIRKDKK